MLYFKTMGPLKTDFLLAQPSFLSGLARLLDIFGVFDSYNESRTPEDADARAMYADWRITGQDIYASASQFEEEVQETKSKQLSLAFSK